MLATTSMIICACAITGGEKRFSPLVDPGEIGWLAMEETRDGVYQHGVGRSGMETAGFFQGQDPLHPMIALVTSRAQQALTPQHPKAQGPVELSEEIALPAGLQNRACH